jgi:exodeoxyribonuclease VII large subunit
MSALLPPAGVRIYTVGELTRAVKELIEEAHPSVWVEGEVSNLARPVSGHVYLTLKDDEAPLRAVLYRGIALRLRFDLRDGMKVVVRGRLSVYERRGEYQLLIEEVHPKGIGPLELAFRQLKEKLSVLGYFDPARKKPLPRFPRRIALVTSGTGSAVRDLLEVLARRWPATPVWVCPVRVQGEGAAAEIAAALTLLNQIGSPEQFPAGGAPSGTAPIDVLVLARGGGSLEDLWPFNEEIVARAIFASAIPVVTGVGHEDDLTIADLVADLRALTPTHAAQQVVPDRTEMLDALDAVLARLRALLANHLELARTRLEHLASRPCLRRPNEPIRERRLRLEEWAERLRRAAGSRLERAGVSLDSLAARLEAVSPLKVLARGYSLTRRLDDKSVVRGPDGVRAGDWLVTQVQAGRIVSRVESVQSESTTGPHPEGAEDHE